MDLYFAGAESPVYLHTLEALGVTHIAVSFFEWQRRYSGDDLYRHVPDGMKVCITPGVSRKELDFNVFGRDYLEFCERNAEHSLVYDLDAPNCPPALRATLQRELSALPNVVVFPTETQTLPELARTYERLGVNARLAKSLSGPELRRVAGSLYGSNVTDPRTLRAARFTATTSFAWLSGRRYGELWVWARAKLHHYTAANLAKAVRAHTGDIEALGVDPVACLAGEREALTAVGVRSLQAMALSLSQRPRDRHRAEASTASAPEASSKALAVPDGSPDAPRGSEEARPVTLRPRELLPVVELFSQDGRMKVSASTESLRQCDTCYLAGVCPKFSAASSCAYAVPVEIKTDAQWEAACQALLEIQFQRISFGHFAEQVEGGAINPRVGQEMDRFYKMLGSVKELKSAPAELGDGPLSRIFGRQANESLEEMNFEPESGTDDTAQEEASEEGWSEEYAAYLQDFEEQQGAAEDDHAGSNSA